MPVVNSYINDSQLYHDLKQMGRDNFTYAGAVALMEYLDNLSDDIGENIEYDPIAFCCEYSEYEDLEELQEVYPDIESFDDLEDNTSVIYINGYQDEESPFIILDY